MIDKDTFKRHVEEFITDEMGLKMAAALKMLGAQTLSTSVDGVMKDIESMLAEVKKEAYDEAYKAFQKDIEKREAAAFKRGVEFGKAIINTGSKDTMNDEDDRRFFVIY